MIFRFCAYTVCRNFRPFEPFLLLFFLLDLKLSYSQAGLLLAYQYGVWAALEVPGGILTDWWGRRRALIASFIFNGVAFTLLTWCALTTNSWAMLITALTCYSFGESLRSGSHKALMLHWAELTNQTERADEIIALTRMFSKTTAGVAAIGGGLMVWLTGGFSLLFVASAVVCAVGLAVIWSYPRELDASWGDDAPAEGPAEPWSARVRRVFARPGLITLMLGSVVFESQFRAARAYVQPYLEEGLKQENIAVVGGVGGLLIGLFFLVQDVFAGLAAMQGKRLKRRVGGVVQAVTHIYQFGALAVVALAVCLWFDVRWLGLPALILLTGLQNIRRPLFVSALDRFMDRRLRATMLSLEQLLRCVAYSVSVAVGGWLAESGLRWAYAWMAALFVLGLWPSLSARRTARLQEANKAAESATPAQAAKD